MSKVDLRAILMKHPDVFFIMEEELTGFLKEASFRLTMHDKKTSNLADLASAIVETHLMYPVSLTAVSADVCVMFMFRSVSHVVILAGYDP